MGTFFVYILKSAVCLALFYLFYRLLLSRETFHRFNRFALLGLLVLVAFLPLVQVSVEHPAEVQLAMLSIEELLMMANASVAAEEEASAMAWWIEAALLLYVAGIFFFMLRHVYSLGRLAYLLRSSSREPLERYIVTTGRARLWVHDKEIAPFSWMNCIVVNRTDLEENGREILTHELAHIRNRHSLDLLVADVGIFLQWFNPAAWLLKQELQTIHEYEADETVIHTGIDAKQYQLLLIKKAVGTRLYSMSNSLNHSKLKKRITMMMKEKSNPWARMKYLYVLPLAAIAVTAFARPEISNVTEEISKASAGKVSELVADRQAKVQEIGDTAKVDVVSTKFEVVEQMPEYPGGLGALMKFLGENIKYPAQAVKDSIQGRVVVTFVVDRDGSTRDFEVLRSVSPELDAEAVRVLALMPKWKPGMQKGTAVNVKYTIPVMFSLNKKKAPVTKGNTVSLRTAGGAKAANVLVVVNEKFYTTVEGLKRIKPEDIQSIDVLKDAKAIKAYGDVAKGKEGLIKVTLKPGAGMDANRGATEH